MKKLYLSFTLILIALLTGCTTVDTRVTVFHEIDNKPKKFAFLYTQDQRTSLEHKSYVDLVTKKLIEKGFEQTILPNADYAVGLAYGINSKDVLNSTPVIGQTGIASAMKIGNTTTFTPSYGTIGYRSSTDTVYTRTLKLIFYDRKYFDETKQIKTLYEAKAVSKGSTGELSIIMPYLVDSIFKDFPGNNGSTKEYTFDFK